MPTNPITIPVDEPRSINSSQEPDFEDINRVVAEQIDSPLSVGISSRTMGLTVSTDFNTPLVPCANDSSERMLSTSDLIKLFEITLVEIRSSQTWVFSALGYSVACGPIIQKLHDPGTHNDKVALGLWLIGVAFCAIGAFIISLNSSHLNPLDDLIVAARSGKSDKALDRVIGALQKANQSVRKAHQLKTPMVIGILFVVSAVFYEFYKCKPK
jgi:hypothetical protein